VFLKIVESSGRSRDFLSRLAPKLRIAGRSIAVLTAAVSVYNIAAAKDKVEAARQELLGVGGGFVGGAREVRPRACCVDRVRPCV
jgi:hypothetical protein